MSALIGTLEPFISAEELRLALADPELDDERAQWLCEWGSAAVRAEVAQSINLVQDDDIIVDGSGSEVVLLPELEVRAVRAVILDGRELHDGTDYAWNAAGCLRRLHAGRRPVRWPARARCLHVNYDHGWLPGSVQWGAARQVALEAAARKFSNPELLQTEQLGESLRAWPVGARAQLTDMEKRSLDCLRSGV